MESMVKLDDIKPGMIGQSGGEIFIQRAIRFFTRSIFSHSFIVINGPYQVPSVMQTTETVVTISDLVDKYKDNDYVVIWDPQASLEEKESAAREVYRLYAAQWYGYLSYFWYLWRFFTGSKRIWKWATPGITCTELVCQYLTRLNSQFNQLFIGLDLSSVTPEDLNIIMLNNPHLFKMVGWVKEKK